MQLHLWEPQERAREKSNRWESAKRSALGKLRGGSSRTLPANLGKTLAERFGARQKSAECMQEQRVGADSAAAAVSCRLAAAMRCGDVTQLR